MLRRLLSHWQHENVDDDSLELLEESNMIKLRMTIEQARSGFCFLQVRLGPSALHIAAQCPSLLCLCRHHPCTSSTHPPADFLCHPQRRSLQQQVNMLSEEVRRLEQELDEARERGDAAMLQASAPQE